MVVLKAETDGSNEAVTIFLGLNNFIFKFLQFLAQLRPVNIHAVSTYKMALDSNNMLNMQGNVMLFTNYNVHFEIKSAIKI